MDSPPRLIIPLHDTESCRDSLVGGKAASLSRLIAAGFRVPRGFCITVHAYDLFVREHGIDAAIRMEIERKPLGEMRWEEIWDAALRIRSRFLSQPVPEAVHRATLTALEALEPTWPLVARSSAPGEDSATSSFAGLHESILDIEDTEAMRGAVRLVWASLWSDAALLYRRELGLDPARSRMAVLIQETAVADRSGVAFGRHPSLEKNKRAIIEAVPGPCRLLVDGLADPDRWEIDRETRKVVSWERGNRPGESGTDPILDPADVSAITKALFGIEESLGRPPDMEWTGRADSLTLLQARPITTSSSDGDDRIWYLTLRPGNERLQALRHRVVEQLIPELKSEGSRLAARNLDSLDDRALAEALDERRESLEKWKRIYWDEFIPFAHGVRQLGTYYNDAVRPADPYEFVGLLADQDMIATRRNRALGELATELTRHPGVRSEIERALESDSLEFDWPSVRGGIESQPGGTAWLSRLAEIQEQYLDVTFLGERVRDGIQPLLHIIMRFPVDSHIPAGANVPDASQLEARLMEAVGKDRRAEAGDVIQTARLSWKLRDDDNILLGKVESQLLRAIQVAADRLRREGRLDLDHPLGIEAALELARGLRQPDALIELPEPRIEHLATAAPGTSGERPRQLIGQPASRGVATGRVRCIRTPGDLGAFRPGEILVCDAIQPGFTHVVPLAGAVVERRGGMLIHGAIIAREIGIPCVNGVRNAVDLLQDGDLVSVDGHVGIVTVGPPEFDVELQDQA